MMLARVAFPAVLLCVVLVGPATASPWHWGARAGLNAADFGGEFGDLVGPDMRLTPNLALVGEYRLAPHLSIHAEGGYSGKGGRSRSERTDNAGNPTGTFEGEWQFDYLEVPMLMRAEIPTSSRVTPYLEVGPSFGIALRGRFVDDTPGYSDVNFSNDLKPVDFGFAGGAGVYVQAGGMRLGFEARYTGGFSDLYDISNNLATVNRAWSFDVSLTR